MHDGDIISIKLKELGIQFSPECVSRWIVSSQADGEDIGKIMSLLDEIKLSNDAVRRKALIGGSRIPQASRKTFENFDYSVTTDKNRETLLSLRSLSFLDAGFNVIISGDKGTGKTHIAQAIGNQCIEDLRRVCFLTLRDLQDRIRRSIDSGKTSTLVANLAGFQCLIIDEVGFCCLSEEETQVFFSLVNKRYSSGYGAMVITSNCQPSGWEDIFADKNAALCMLDRLFDRSICIDFRGPSYRGKNKIIEKMNFFSEPKIPGLITSR